MRSPVTTLAKRTSKYSGKTLKRHPLLQILNHALSFEPKQSRYHLSLAHRLTGCKFTQRMVSKQCSCWCQPKIQPEKGLKKAKLPEKITWALGRLALCGLIGMPRVYLPDLSACRVPFLRPYSEDQCPRPGTLCELPYELEGG